MNSILLRKIFFIAFFLRFSSALALYLSGSLFSGLSRDSAKYHYEGAEIASALQFGISGPRASWIDDAWFRIIGHVYYWLVPEPFLIQLINISLGSFAAVLTAKMGYLAYNNIKVGYFSGLMVAVFPSFVYFNSLLLKDALSLFLFSLLGWAVIALRKKIDWKYVLALLISLMCFLGIRSYLFYICIPLIALCLLPLFGRSSITSVSFVIMLVILSIISWFLDVGFLGINFFQESKYLDIEYINATRAEMNAGRGRMGLGGWGENYLSDVTNILAGIYYFFFSINPFSLNSIRQYFALPEMLIMMLAVLPFLRGLKVTWNHFRGAGIPLVILGLSVLVVYTSTTTNIGALYRWRMQAFPFLFPILAAGLMLSNGNLLTRLMNSVTRNVNDLGKS